MFTVPTIFCKYIIKASLMEVKFQSFTIFRTKYFFMWKLGISESTYFFFERAYIHSTFLMISKTEDDSKYSFCRFVLGIKEIQTISKRTYPKLSLKSKETKNKEPKWSAFLSDHFFPLKVKI